MEKFVAVDKLLTRFASDLLVNFAGEKVCQLRRCEKLQNWLNNRKILKGKLITLGIRKKLRGVRGKRLWRLSRLEVPHESDPTPWKFHRISLENFTQFTSKPQIYDIISPRIHFYGHFFCSLMLLSRYLCRLPRHKWQRLAGST
jgi:hypothetical protein